MKDTFEVLLIEYLGYTCVNKYCLTVFWISTTFQNRGKKIQQVLSYRKKQRGQRHGQLCVTLSFRNGGILIVQFSDKLLKIVFYLFVD